MLFRLILYTLLTLMTVFNKVFAIEAYIQPVVFYDTELNPYTEIRIFIHEKGFKKILSSDSTYSYGALLTLVLKSGNSIIRAEKIELNSLNQRHPSPLIHQLRWALTGFEFELMTTIEDSHNPEAELTLINLISCQPSKDSFLSGIQLSTIIKSSEDSSHILYKNGIYSEPLIYHHLGPGQNVLYAYFESYATQSIGAHYVLKFSISKKDSSGIYQAGEEWFKKRKTADIDPYLFIHDISSYTSGDYRLTVQIRNTQSLVIAEKFIDFTRSNPFWDRIEQLTRIRKEDKYFFDTLAEQTVDYSIRSMYPILSSLDVSVLNDLFKEKRMLEKRAFLFTYWSSIADQEKKDARSVFENHYKLIQSVDKLFYSGFGYGFETDRGVIYLKYGKPNEVIFEDKDNGAFPYEIWKYSKIEKTGQTNVKFLFYNPDLAGSDFRLLHSTAHGERQNKRWEIELYENAPGDIRGNNQLDAEEMLPNFNRRAREYFTY
jgi:GWxTD domain-containing protein